MHINPPFLYVIAVLSGLTFAAIAWRAGRGPVLWGISGSCYGLILSTCVVGLGHAIAVPYSEAVVSKNQMVSLIISVLLLVLTAAVTMLSLRKREPVKVEKAPVSSGAESPCSKPRQK